jgi:peptidyl-prolyl cis-trans isomerase-like protein 2
MSFTPATKIIAATISDEQYLFQNINEKALLQIKTNFGDMNFELYCKECPRTCYNMIMLAKQGRYDNSIFHRSIRGFMVQGGDFTNKDGSGGESYWSKPFKDEFHHSLQHKGRGMLAMANRGPNSNTSQVSKISF